MDNWILVVFVLASICCVLICHLHLYVRWFVFVVLQGMSSTVSWVSCVLYVSDGGDQHFHADQACKRAGALESGNLLLCSMNGWMALAQINYKVPPSTLSWIRRYFVDSSSHLGVFGNDVQGSSCNSPFLLRVAREAAFACLVVMSSLFIRQLFL